jgi:addiction module RelE/StbE family toxin
MTYQLALSHQADHELKKLAHKDQSTFLQVLKKLERVTENPYHFKPLHGDLFGARRIHIGSYVLTYEIRPEEEEVVVLHYQHHDKIYKLTKNSLFDLKPIG